MAKYVGFLCAVVALLMPVEMYARTWTDSSGEFRVEAEFVELDKGQVKLKKDDGRIITIALDKLSPANRSHAKRLAAKKPAADKPDVSVEKKSKADPSPNMAAKTPSAPVKTGRFSISFQEYSPLSASGSIFPRMLSPANMKTTMAQIQSRLGSRPFPEHFYEIKSEMFQIYVPDDYDPILPYGLLVFIHSGDDGSPKEEWFPILKRRRLMFIAADKSGNDHDPITRRGALALDAVHNMSKQYRIDPGRVYIVGSSGGGRNASWMAMAFPDVFTGGMYVIGANSYKSVPSEKGPVQALIHIPSPQLFNAAKQYGRYVYLTGDLDFNQAEMKAIAAGMKSDGFRYVTYLQVPGMGHAEPPLEWLVKSIVALDEPLAEAAAESFKRGNAAFQQKRYPKALELLRVAASHSLDRPFTAEALDKLQKVTAIYDAEAAAVEQLIEQGDYTAATKRLGEFRKRWGDSAQTDAARLSELLKAAKKQSS